MRSGALTLLENITQTESKYLRQRAFKDIGTVRNMIGWVVVCFVCFKDVGKCMLPVKRGKRIFGHMYDMYDVYQ
jgi:hypothetical protein